jgi:hypothetical protein
MVKMNDYSHALVKEIAAQQLGFKPSHVWGKIGKKEKLKHPPEAYLHIMRSQEPHEIQSLKATQHVIELAKKFKEGIPKRSHIKKDSLQF